MLTTFRGVFLGDGPLWVLPEGQVEQRDRGGVPGPGGGDVLISNVCTQPRARRQGHGQAAFTAVLDWARSTGAARAELMATGDGLTLYEAAGFTATRFPAMRASLPVPLDQL